MSWSLAALFAGFCIDCALGDPHGLPHPVVGMGRLISSLERRLRLTCPKTARGEICAGALLWLIVVLAATAIPAALLWACQQVSPWLRFAAESLMCWQILAVKSLRVEAMLVYRALQTGSLEQAQYAVSRIVGRDTARLDRAGVIKAAVETVAENTSDGVIAPMLFLAVGGAPLGFFYKAVNTMDSMLGYVDPPYQNIGLVPAKMDDIMNYVPARLSALLLLAAGVLLGMDGKAGWRMFRRDRYRHASPNSGQTEAACAGLMHIQLGGDAWYHGVLHQKPSIGDPIRAVEAEDIPRVCRLMTAASLLSLLLLGAVKYLLLR